jgi:hypothetical protein
VLATGRPVGAKGGAEAGANHKPEQQRRSDDAHHTRALPVEAYNFAPPQRERRQQQTGVAAGGGRGEGRSLVSCHEQVSGPAKNIQRDVRSHSGRLQTILTRYLSGKPVCNPLFGDGVGDLDN